MLRAFQVVIGACKRNRVSPLGISARSEEVAGAETELRRFTPLRNFEPEGAIRIDSQVAGSIQIFKNPAQEIRIRNDFTAYGLAGQGVKRLAILSPFLCGADHLRTLL